MEGLRVVFFREREHFLSGDFIRAEIGLGADFQVLEISHGARIAGDMAWRERKGRATNRAWRPMHQECNAGIRG